MDAVYWLSEQRCHRAGWWDALQVVRQHHRRFLLRFINFQQANLIDGKCVFRKCLEIKKFPEL
jgi:hypothetical protein